MNRLKEMAQLFAPSGLEQKVREYCMQYQGNLEVSVDGCGNLIFHRVGMGKRIAYLCGMDEKGIFLSHKENDNQFRYCTLGDCSDDALDNRQILLEKGGKGIIEKEFVTVTQGTAQIGESGVVVGESAETEHTLTAFGCLRAVCCEVVLQSMEEDMEGDLWFVFSSLYQMGKKGALVALSQIKPELAFFVEGVSAEKREESTLLSLEKGPVVKIRDGAFMDTLCLADVLEGCDIPYQLYVSAKQEIGGRPGMIFGVPSVIIGIPYEAEQYFAQTIQKNIVKQTKELILELQRRLEAKRTNGTV